MYKRQVKRSLVGPGNHVVTLRTIGDREGRLITGVGWIIRRVVGGQVATRVPAIGRLSRQSVVPVDVALGAGRHFTGGSHLMRIRQREASGAVIERRVRPRRCIVARRALRSREASLHMVRDIAPERLRAVPIRLVAAVAVGVGAREAVVVVDVAERAGCGEVGAGEREPGYAVVKRRNAVSPRYRVVASGA